MAKCREIYSDCDGSSTTVVLHQPSSSVLSAQSQGEFWEDRIMDISSSKDIIQEQLANSMTRYVTVATVSSRNQVAQAKVWLLAAYLYFVNNDEDSPIKILIP